MKINWKKIENINKYVSETLSKEADDIPKEKLQDSWVEEEIDFNKIKVDENMIRQHDSEKMHIRRKDDFIQLIKQGKLIFPLIVLGKDLFLVDGYARYRAIKDLGIRRVKVFKQDFVQSELTDETITIKPYIDLSLAKIQLTNEDADIVKFLIEKKSTLKSVVNWIKKNQDYWKNKGPSFAFAIFDKSNSLVGMVEANTDHNKIEELQEGDANISYEIFPFARGKGYSSRAVKLIMKFLKSIGVRRAILRISPENKYSLLIPKKCGFAKIGETNKNGEINLIFVKVL